jgi:hypothetical protein
MQLEVGMSSKALKRLVFLFLFVGLVGLMWRVLKLPPEAVAHQGAPALTFQGGSGDTPATAVMIMGAPDYVRLVAGEYQYLAKQFGKQDHDWQVAKKEVYQCDDKVYDLITIEFPKGAKRQIFFDITKNFKKP